MVADGSMCCQGIISHAIDYPKKDKQSERFAVKNDRMITPDMHNMQCTQNCAVHTITGIKY